MSNEKQLPKEVVEKIRQSAINEVGGDYIGGAKGIIKDGIIQRRTEGAKIAQSHYDPIIEEMNKGYDVLNGQLRNALKDVGDLQIYMQTTKQGKLGASVCKEATRLLTEKDATIAKLMGLLEGSVKRNIKNLIQDGSQPLAFVEKAQNVEWESFKKDNGL